MRIEEDEQEQLLDHPAASESRRDEVSVAIALLVAGGLLLVVAAGPIAAGLANLLPGRGQVRGLGTNFESFDAVAPRIIRRSGVVLLIAAAVVAATGRLTSRFPQVSVVRPTRVRHTRAVAQGAIAVLSAAWYGWLAHPHNAYRSNARFHWVDYLTFDSDNYFYAAGRVPHLLFYDAPYLWQATNVVIVVLLIAWISNRIGLSTPASLAMCATPAVASNVLLFADTAEDVMLNFALLLALVAAVLTRRPLLVGLALSAAVLGRPSFIVLAACLPGAEILAAMVRERSVALSERLRCVDWRFVLSSGAIMAASTAAFQALFTVLGRRYMLTRGRIIDTGPLENVEPTDVDGFQIWPFSGAYALHFLWVMPLVFLVGTVVAVVGAQRYQRSQAVAVYFSVLSVAAILFVHESQPLLYYNIRYLTYVWPFLFVASWIAFSNRRRPLAPAGTAGVIVLLTIGTMVLPVDPIQLKRSIEERPETELLAIRHDVAELVGDGRVTVTFGGKSTQNLLAYVIRDSRNRISTVSAEEVGLDSVVITRRGSPLDGRAPTIETDSLLIYAPIPASDTSG